MLEKSDELKDRVEARRHKLLSKYNELKADTRAEASEARRKIKARLDEIEDALKAGWNNISEAAKAKLNKWLDED
jgi:F0F1-type ATP synthase membrane subunit b/b'